MALSRNYRLCTSFAVTSLLCCLCLAFVSEEAGSRNNEDELIRKTVLGSRPPVCANKCMSCRPCEATLVIPPHKGSYYYDPHESHREDDSYYLLSWKCRCGNKLYQP